MRACSRCGEQSDERSRFCWSCGAPLAPAASAPRETRRTVTVVFCDVVGSTTLAERQDVERVRTVMSRYFAEMAAVVERHGGTVGKFIGDAVMAVFGTPVLDEDDALPALRAAVGMQQSLVALNEEFERSYDVRIEVRIGVNTGEVIVGDPRRSDTLVTGDAVNTADRLQHTAGPGEIVLGEATYRLARDAIVAEQLPPLALRGKEGAQRAYRLLDVTASPARARPIRAPFVGREAERALLREALERAVAERACRMVTVLGPPGIGKSRFVAEIVRELGEAATVLRGTCLPYGEGITFWPVIEVVSEAARAGERDPADDLRRKLGALLAGTENDALVADRVAELIGAAGAPVAAEEAFWAVRKLLEALAAPRPLVVVFDDVHWGEPTFLDLVEHVADWSRSVPILLVCIARPELLETRPGWREARPNATEIFLEPLTRGESERLFHALLGDVGLPDDVRARIHEAAEGYPLFVEEMLSMLVDNGLLRLEDGRWTALADIAQVPVPATVNLLLASRIDRLPDDERQVLERASVEGRVFHRDAVHHLAPSSAGAGADVDGALAALGRKHLIGPEPAAVHGEDAFAFRHILIRDAAYESIPKQARADLHERFAGRLEASATGETDERAEFVGFHLEQSFRYRAELHRVDAADRALAGRAGRHLAAAGRRARVRGDVPAAVKLLERATGLLREDGALGAQTLIDLGSAQLERGDLALAEAAFAEAVESAAGAGDARLESWATVEGAFIRVLVDPSYDSQRLRDVSEAALPVLEAAGDELGVAVALTRVAEAHWRHGNCAGMDPVLEDALVHADRAGDPRELLHILEHLVRVLVVGPRPVSEALPRCRAILEQARDRRRLAAWAESLLAVLEAMCANADEARVRYRHSHEVLGDLGLGLLVAGARLYAGMAELVLGDPEAAERELRRSYDGLEAIGERAQLSTAAAFLARALIAQERYDEGERYSMVSERLAASDDRASQILWRGARARACARRGDVAGAERLARDAVEMAESTDFLNTQGDALVDLAHVLRLAGRPAADDVLADALARYEAKGNVVSAAEVRAARAAWHVPSG